MRVERIPDPRRKNLIARKGGGKGGSAPTTPHTPTEYPNTIRSLATVRILEVLSEGVVSGMHSAHYGGPFWNSVYLDNTPAADAAGNWQFRITQGDFRYGTPSQDAIPGYPISEASYAVGVKCTYGVPVVRTLSRLGLTSVRITLQWPALYMQETDGDINGTNCAYGIDVQVDGAVWANWVTEEIWGKTMSPYQRSLLFTLPAYTDHCAIRVERLSNDDVKDINNELFFSSYVEIEDGQLAYDDTSVMSMTVDAEQFPSVPQRGYLLDGMMMLIPTNYDGYNHTYTAPVWDGTFYTQWTNNPAWVLYNLLVNERWGLGRFLDVNAIDKWGFYDAALFSDQGVPDGKGGYEYRYTCNCVINTRQDAWQVLTAVASNMMAQIYYANGTVFLVQDRPLYSPERLFTPADIEAGLFDYSGTDYRSVHNAAAVTWIDPDNLYVPTVELVLDGPLVAEQGYKETQQTAFACTSRGQATRLGRWLIYTSQFEREVVSFRTAMENADVRPGMLIAINDPGRAGARLGGRLLDDAGSDTITLDALADQIASNPTAWIIYVTAGDTQMAQKPVVVGLPVLGVVGGTQLRVANKPVDGLFPNSMWLGSTHAVEPTLWRVNAVAELGKGQFQITATEYHVEKWTYVETGWLIPPPSFSLIPKGPLPPPTNITDTEYIYRDATNWPQFGVIISWTPSTDPRVAYYQLEASGPKGDYRRFERIVGVTQDMLAMRQGQWTIVMKAFDNLGRASIPVTFTFSPIGLSAKPLPPDALYIEPQSGNTIDLIWTPTNEIDVVYYWIKWAPETDGSAVWTKATTSIAQVSNTTTQISTPARAGTYMVKSIDALGQESDDYIEAIYIVQVTEQVRVYDDEEQPGWSGTLNRWTLHGPEIWLAPPTAPETTPPGVFPGDRWLSFNATPTRVEVYDFTAPFDLGMVTRVTMTAIVQAYGLVDSTVMADWKPLASAVPLEGGTFTNAWDAHIEVSISQDNSSWADWTPLKSTFVTGRAFKWRLVGAIYDLVTTLHAVRAGVIIDIPLRNVSGNNVALDPATGTLTVTYAVPFMATPTVQITAQQSIGPGGQILITESDRNHFKVQATAHAAATVRPVDGTTIATAAAKPPMQAPLFNTGTRWNTTTQRFETLAGNYTISCAVMANNVTGSQAAVAAYLYRNGTEIARSTGGGPAGAQVSASLSINVTSVDGDYYELYVSGTPAGMTVLAYGSQFSADGQGRVQSGSIDYFVQGYGGHA
jgi:predicted phage tail protein